MLRIAVPNKGTLSGPAADMLREAGYRQRTDPKDLVCRDEANDVEFFYLRPRDIATYVGSGELELGITGRDLLIDSGSPAEELLDLDFAGATFRFAARPETLTRVPEQIAGRRIATAYPGVVESYLGEHGLKAEVVRLDGAVENAIRLGVADVIADVVETGADHFAAAPRRLGGGAGHGPPCRGAPDHGRAVRPGCPRHPGHRHPRLPPLTHRPPRPYPAGGQAGADRA